jgi:hypothetical protein
MSRNWVAVLARQATQAGGTDSSESILGLFESLKIRVSLGTAVEGPSPVTNLKANS